MLFVNITINIDLNYFSSWGDLVLTTKPESYQPVSKYKKNIPMHAEKHMLFITTHVQIPWQLFQLFILDNDTFELLKNATFFDVLEQNIYLKNRKVVYTVFLVKWNSTLAYCFESLKSREPEINQCLTINIYKQSLAFIVSVFDLDDKKIILIASPPFSLHSQLPLCKAVLRHFSQLDTRIFVSQHTTS